MHVDASDAVVCAPRFTNGVAPGRRPHWLIPLSTRQLCAIPRSANPGASRMPPRVLGAIRDRCRFRPLTAPWPGSSLRTGSSTMRGDMRVLGPSMRVLALMVVGCTAASGEPGAASPGATSAAPLPTQSAPAPADASPVVAGQSDMPTCPPDTEAYDAEEHEVPPMDAPVASCFVPEVSSEPGPPKHAVPLESATP